VYLIVLCAAASAIDRNKSNSSLSSLSSDVKVLSSSPLRSVTTRRPSRQGQPSARQVMIIVSEICVHCTDIVQNVSNECVYKAGILLSPEVDKACAYEAV